MLLSPETPGEAPSKTKVKTVQGRRLVDRTEQFVIVDESPATEAAPDAAVQAENLCDFCGIVFSVEKWDDNDGYCPNCNRDENGDLQPEERELSEAEMLLQSIENDGEYSLHVERLVNYEKDGRTDTRADKSFCTKLKPVTLDYLDIVRREFGGGAYRFSMYRKGVGLVKNGIWVDVIEKPLEVAAPIVAAQQAAPPASPDKEDPIAAITSAATKLANLKDALVGDELRELREELRQQRTGSNNGVPDNQFALLHSVLSSPNSGGLAEKLIDRVMPEETKTTWMGDLLAHPQEAMSLLGVLLDRVERIFGAHGPQPPNGNGAHAALPPPSLNQMLPPPVLAVLEIIGEDVMNFEPAEEDGELSDSVYRATDAILDAAETDVTVEQVLKSILSMSPVEIGKLISGQAGIAQPGMEHLRIVGYEYIAKKKDVDVFFRQLKQAVNEAAAERQSNNPPSEPGGLTAQSAEAANA